MISTNSTVANAVAARNARIVDKFDGGNWGRWSKLDNGKFIYESFNNLAQSHDKNVIAKAIEEDMRAAREILPTLQKCLAKLREA